MLNVIRLVCWATQNAVLLLLAATWSAGNKLALLYSCRLCWHAVTHVLQCVLHTQKLHRVS